jgi:hypothetical protein
MGSDRRFPCKARADPVLNRTINQRRYAPLFRAG